MSGSDDLPSKLGWMGSERERESSASRGFLQPRREKGQKNRAKLTTRVLVVQMVSKVTWRQGGIEMAPAEKSKIDLLVVVCMLLLAFLVGVLAEKE